MKLPIISLLKFGKFIFTLTFGLVGVFLLFALIPIEGNYKLLVVQSGSMQPEIPLGSVVMVLPQSEYSVGDVVTFSPSAKDKESLVTHRIAGYPSDIFGLVYQTKGDANKAVDPGTIPKEQIIGKVVFTVPHVGIYLTKLKTPLGFILAVVVPATIVIYEEIKKIYQSFRDSLLHFLKQKRRPHLSLGKDELTLLQSINQLRRENQLSFDSRIPLFLLFFGLSFAFVGMTKSFFSDVEIGTATLAATEGSPPPTASPSPSATPHIVINEVYYDVDKKHGVDSPGDRGVKVGKHKTKVRHKSGPASQNDGFVDIEILCSVVQNNQTDVDVDINISSNTGSNTAFGNVLGNSSINSGDVASAVVIDIQGGSNTLFGFCGSSKSRNDEWIELYNPTSQTVNLKDWTITDNSGVAVNIPGNRNLDPGEFALISKSNSTWAFWDEPPDTLKIPLGRQIGDGLDDEGDRLILKNAQGQIVDAMSYGDDTSEFTLPDVSEGHSLERQPDGLDTDTAVDWIDRFPPAPGI